VLGHPGQIRLLLSDMMMPDTSGPKVFSRLVKEWPDLKVLFMSGHPASAFSQYQMTEKDFLQKPFGVSELLRKVREVLDRE